MLNTLVRSRQDPDAVVSHNLGLVGGLDCFWPLWPTGGNEPPFEIVRNMVLPGLERMYEVITPNSTGHRSDWKSFQHYKRWIPSTIGNEPTLLFATDAFIPYVPNSCGNWNQTNFWTDPTHSLARVAWYTGTGTAGTFRPWERSDLPKLYDPTSDDGTAFVPSPAELGALQQAALQSVMPVIKAELSLINSLIELKDVRTIWHSAGRILEDVVTPLIQKFGSVAGRRSLTLRGLLGVVSDSYLQYKFNFAPLLSDIAGLQRAMLRVEKRLRTLINESMELQTKHFSYKWREHPNKQFSYGLYTLSGDNFYPPITGNTAKTEVYNDSSEFNVTVQYQYDWPVHRVWHARTLALLDALGVNLNPQIVWNAIPWSFVVDWVANVGKFLSQFTIHNLEPKINIRHYCWSIKRKRLLASSLITGVNDIGLPYWPNGISMPTVLETAYRRVVTWPSYSWIQTSGLSPTEVSLGAALAFARKPHFKRNSR
jgi:hypothetical protein